MLLISSGTAFPLRKMHPGKSFYARITVLLLCACTVGSSAGQDVEGLAKAAQNPIASMISVMKSR